MAPIRIALQVVLLIAATALAQDFGFGGVNQGGRSPTRFLKLGGHSDDGIFKDPSTRFRGVDGNFPSAGISQSAPPPSRIRTRPPPTQFQETPVSQFQQPQRFASAGPPPQARAPLGTAQVQSPPPAPPQVFFDSPQENFQAPQPQLTQPQAFEPSQSTFRGTPPSRPSAPVRTTLREPSRTSEQQQEDAKIIQQQNANAKYSFVHGVTDTIADHQHVREETRDGLALKGMYSYSDGYFRRTVNYEADENGYRVVKEDVEPIGNGPQEDPAGRANVLLNVQGQPVEYTITAADFQKKNPLQQQPESQFGRLSTFRQPTESRRAPPQHQQIQQQQIQAEDPQFQQRVQFQ